MRTVELPEDYALVMQQVNEYGQEDFTNLAESLRLDRSRLSHIIEALQHKKLITISRTAQDTWISLSSRGKRMMAALWPESRLALG